MGGYHAYSQITTHLDAISQVWKLTLMQIREQVGYLMARSYHVRYLKLQFLNDKR
jgi:hypothetical protein